MDDLHNPINRIQSYPVSAYISVQGGGAKGGWQAGVLEELLSSGLIKPTSIGGSSAGAINAVLFEQAFRTGSTNYMSAYWLGRRRLLLKHLFRFSAMKLPLRVFAIVRSILSSRVGLSDPIRHPPLLNFEEFKTVVTTGLTTGPASSSLHLYLFGCPVDGDTPKSFDPNHPYTFALRKGDSDLEMMTIDDRTIRCSLEDAVTCSCCLPLIAPLVVDGKGYSDGGIFSNLPIDFIFTQGSLGARIGIFIMGTPLSDLAKDGDPISHKTLHMLNKIKDGLESASKTFSSKPSSSAATVPSYCATAWLIIAPKKKLSAGLISGFFSNRTMNDAIQQGRMEGRAFCDALKNAAVGQQREPLRGYHLPEMIFPTQKMVPPLFSEWWISFINRKWKNKSMKSDVS